MSAIRIEPNAVSPATTKNAVLSLHDGGSIEIVDVGRPRAYVWVGMPAAHSVSHTTIGSLRRLLAAHDSRLAAPKPTRTPSPKKKKSGATR